MKEMKVLRIRELVLIGAFCISLWGSYPALAQPSAREYERLEARVDRLDTTITNAELDRERRMALIESYQREMNGKVEVLIKLGLGIMASVTGLMIQALWGLIVKRQKQ